MRNASVINTLQIELTQHSANAQHSWDPAPFCHLLSETLNVILESREHAVYFMLRAGILVQNSTYCILYVLGWHSLHFIQHTVYLMFCAEKPWLHSTHCILNALGWHTCPKFNTLNTLCFGLINSSLRSTCCLCCTQVINDYPNYWSHVQPMHHGLTSHRCICSTGIGATESHVY